MEAGSPLKGVESLNGQARLLDELAQRQIQQLLIEGGPTVITSFLTKALADEICIYISPKTLGPEGDIDISKEMAELADQKCLKNIELKQFDEDKRITGHYR